MSNASNEEFGTATAADTIRFERILPGPIERVWSYITESAKRGQWLAAGQWELRAGGKAELNFHHADLTPHDEEIPEKYKALENGVSFSCEVVRCEPPHLVTILWREDRGDSEVSFELSERDDGQVRLVLVHSGLTADGMRDSGSGWHTHLRILEDRLNGREPAPFWAAHAKLESEYAKRLGRD